MIRGTQSQELCRWVHVSLSSSSYQVENGWSSSYSGKDRCYDDRLLDFINNISNIQTWCFPCLLKGETAVEFTLISINFASNAVIKREERKIFDFHTRLSSPVAELNLWCSQAVHCIIKDSIWERIFSSSFVDIHCERFFYFSPSQSCCYLFPCHREENEDFRQSIYSSKKCEARTHYFFNVFVIEKISTWTQRNRCKMKIEISTVKVRLFDVEKNVHLAEYLDRVHPMNDSDALQATKTASGKCVISFFLISNSGC